MRVKVIESLHLRKRNKKLHRIILLSIIFTHFMKKRYILLLPFLILAAACSNSGSPYQYTTQPAIGTVVGTAVMPVKEDALNKFTFGVNVVADSEIADGVYDVNVNYEYHTAQAKFTMPKEIKNMRPLIRAGKEPYTYIIGFKVPKDTTFYDYFEVRVASNNIYMDYLKGYTF
jgi:hypothetical protein